MTQQTPVRLDAATAHRELTEHDRFRYRGCAPDVDEPRLAAGDLSVPVDAWQAPDLDGGEDPDVRKAREAAAVDVCMGCPVMVVCDAYGASLTEDGKLAEPYSVLGGRTPLERHRAFVAYKKAVAEPVVAAPERQLHTEQKTDVLRALAAHTTPEAVAEAAGTDVRTANWQRSILVTKLGLTKPATRMQLLRAAAERGLLDGVDIVDDGGTVPAVPRPPARPRRRSDVPATVASELPEPVEAEPEPPEPIKAQCEAEPESAKPVRIRFERKNFTSVVGQIGLNLVTDTDDGISEAPDALITELPRRPRVLEAAA